MSKPAPSSSSSTGVSVLDYRNASPSLPRRALRFAFSFIMVHYLFHGCVAGLALYALVSAGPAGIIAAAVLVLMYLPSFLNEDQVRAGWEPRPRRVVKA